jgi:hypothetical protein
MVSRSERRNAKPMRALAALAMLAGCGGGAGPFDRAKLDDVVTRVRPLVREPGKLYLFHLDASLDPASLRALPDSHQLGRGDGRGLIRAGVDHAHRLAVSVETRDNGHAGEDGFLFRDPGVTEADVETVEREVHQTAEADGWVRWSYDLD